jgi:hypothetical protein
VDNGWWHLRWWQHCQWHWRNSGNSGLDNNQIKNNNKLRTRLSKVGGGWRKSINDHRTMTAGNDKQREPAVDDEGSNKEGKGGKGDGDYNESGLQQRG